MKRLVIFTLILATVAYACVEIGRRGARTVEQLVTARITSGLEVIGLDWAEVRADGLRVELRGHAPDLFARDLAVETARATVPLAEIIDFTTASLAPPERREPVYVEMLRDSSGLTLTGRFAGERMRDRLLAALAAAAPGLEFHDLTGVNAARPRTGWGAELDVAALAAARIPNAFVRIEPGAVRVEGLARDEAHRRELSAELLALAGDSVMLTLALRYPLEVAVPFAFSVVKEGEARLRLEICTARDADEAAALEALLTRADVDGVAGRCREALGGPPGDWPRAIAAGLRVLDTVPAAQFRLEFRTATLGVLGETTEAEFVAALEALAGALPQGYAAHRAGTAGEAAPGIAAQEARYWMRLTRDEDSVTLAGLAPGAAARAVIETHATANFGRGSVRSALAAGPPAAPENWEQAAMVALDALAGVRRGEAEVMAGQVTVTAEVAGPDQAALVHRELALMLPEGYRPKSRLSVDLPAMVAAIQPDGARCAVLLAGILTDAPIAFAPGSAVLTDESHAVVDRLAGVLKRCPRARFEVAGHTDSQGSENLNQRLSQARAETVLDALLTRGVRLDRLTARGYGEERPLVSNETEEGRARNRRIEFTPAAQVTE